MVRARYTMGCNTGSDLNGVRGEGEGNIQRVPGIQAEKLGNVNSSN